MAAIFHLINHAIFKGALFMVVGIVDHETGTRDMRKLGGLLSVMPITFTIALIGTFSMAGLPPFNGFLSKEMFFTAVIGIMEFGYVNMPVDRGVFFPVIAWVASIFTFGYSMILLFRTVYGPRPNSISWLKSRMRRQSACCFPGCSRSLAIVFGLFPEFAGLIR